MAAAHAIGVDVSIGSDRCHELSARWGVPLALDFRSPERAVAAVLAHATEEPFAAVIPTDDASTVIAARVAVELGLISNPPDSAYAARNKAVMRERLHAAGVAGPSFRLLRASATPSELAAAMADVGGPPVVVKPVLMSGSRGVIRADDAAARLGPLAP